MWIRALLLALLVSGTAFAENYNPDAVYAPGTEYTLSMPHVLNFSRPSVYTGTLKPYTNPFTRRTQYIMDKGVYRDQRGFVYAGVFDYLPLKEDRDAIKKGLVILGSGGFFLFAGEVLDEESGEKSAGIYVSDPPTPITGHSVLFSEATPDYITQVQERYQQSLATVEAEQLSTAQRRQNFGLVLDLFSGVLSLMGGNLSGMDSVVNKYFLAQQAVSVMKATMTGESDMKTAFSGAAGDTLKQVLKSAGGKKAAVLIETVDALAGLKPAIPSH